MGRKIEKKGLTLTVIYNDTKNIIMLHNLSEDVLYLVFDHMDIDSVCKIRVINKKINKLAHDFFIIKKYIGLYGKHRKRYSIYFFIDKHENFFVFVGRNIDNLLFLKTIYSDINIFNIAALGGHNDILMILKKDFPKITCSNDSLIFAAKKWAQ